jgi:aromatic-L-amino-acid decarboxylase
VAAAARRAAGRFEGVIYDTASVLDRSTRWPRRASAPAGVRAPRARGCRAAACGSTLGARALVGGQGGDERSDSGWTALRKIPADADFRMRPERSPARSTTTCAGGDQPWRGDGDDRHDVHAPASIPWPPSPPCARRAACGCTWIPAYAGVQRCCPELRPLYATAGKRADSIVLNPHKWLFTPMDVSVLYLPRDGRAAGRVLARAQTFSRPPRARRACAT